MLEYEDALATIEYYKKAHPNFYTELGGDKITEEKINEALEIVNAISGGIEMSDDELFKRELKRLCNS